MRGEGLPFKMVDADDERQQSDLQRDSNEKQAVLSRIHLMKATNEVHETHPEAQIEASRIFSEEEAEYFQSKISASIELSSDSKKEEEASWCSV